jgi:hypothetical protein
MTRKLDEFLSKQPRGEDVDTILHTALKTIHEAPLNTQSSTLRGQSRTLGFLAGLNRIPQGLAIDCLMDAAAGMIPRHHDQPPPPERLLAIILPEFNYGLRRGWRWSVGFEPWSDTRMPVYLGPADDQTDVSTNPRSLDENEPAEKPSQKPADAPTRLKISRRP